jgi:hypothetical protein
MRRNVHGITFILALTYMIFISIPKNLFTFLLTGKWKLTKAYLRALLWNLKNIFNKDILKIKVFFTILEKNQSLFLVLIPVLQRAIEAFLE